MSEEGRRMRGLVYSPLEDERSKARVELELLFAHRKNSEIRSLLGISNDVLTRWWAKICCAEPERERVVPLEGRTYTKEQAEAIWPSDRNRVRWSRSRR